MKKMIFFLILACAAICTVVISSDTHTLLSYANTVGKWIGSGKGYTEKTANAVQDSVNSSASAVEDLRAGKAREIIEEQRKKIEEMRKELNSSMNDAETKTNSNSKE